MRGALLRRGVLSALQVSVDHLRALNATLLELREGQQDLDQAISLHRERLRDLLQESSCQGCQETLSQAHGLELAADFSQVRAGQRPLEQGGLLCLLPPESAWVLFPEADPHAFPPSQS